MLLTPLELACLKLIRSHYPSDFEYPDGYKPVWVKGGYTHEAYLICREFWKKQMAKS